MLLHLESALTYLLHFKQNLILVLLKERDKSLS